MKHTKTVLTRHRLELRGSELTRLMTDTEFIDLEGVTADFEIKVKLPSWASSSISLNDQVLIEATWSVEEEEEIQEGEWL